MKRQLLILFTLSAVLACMPMQSAEAKGMGQCGGHGGSAGCGIGFGIGGYNDICGYAELYRELYNNLPYFALHPPVYYSHVVPRTYGYSPFAYPPHVMTPELAFESEPVTINNPYVPAAKPAAGDAKADHSAAASRTPEPLVIVNPFVTQSRTVASSAR